MKILKSKEDAIDFLTWIATLESGIFEQGFCGLQTGENQYCCLGIASIISIPEHLSIKSNNGWIRGGFPYHQIKAPYWLKEVNYEFHKRHGNSLSNLNDEGTSHPKIAKLLLKVFHDDINEWFV